MMGYVKAIAEGVVIGLAIWLVGSGLVMLHNFLDLEPAMEAFATVTTAAVIVSVTRYIVTGKN